MSKPLNEFGGWLKFFYVASVIVTVCIPILLIATLYPALGLHARGVLKSADIISLFLKLIPFLIDFGLYLYAVKIFKNQNPAVPTKIALVMLISIVIGILFGFADHHWAASHPDLMKAMKPKEGILEIFRGVIGTLIWVQYFRVSKRVKAYYGSGAFS